MTTDEIKNEVKAHDIDTMKTHSYSHTVYHHRLVSIYIFIRRDQRDMGILTQFHTQTYMNNVPVGTCKGMNLRLAFHVIHPKINMWPKLHVCTYNHVNPYMYLATYTVLVHAVFSYLYCTGT